MLDTSIAMRFGRVMSWLLLAAVLAGHGPAFADVAISDGGSPTMSFALPAPPGKAGMSPKLALAYGGGGVNGPVGHGWSIQGLSAITRCPQTIATDGRSAGVTFGPDDKLCLDGQRLLQTTADGAALASQVNDARGLMPGEVREYRTEKESFSRIRAYGTAGSSVDNGPAYFRVWTKSGLVFDYGEARSSDANTRALITAQGKSSVMVWAAARVADSVGNFMDFKYDQRLVAWGSESAPGAPYLGKEWNLREVQYGGNKVVFNYIDRPLQSPQDRAETYNNGSKNVSISLLKSVTGYANSPNTAELGPAASAVPSTTIQLSYDNGPVTRRSRVVSIRECAGGPASEKCQPDTRMSYSDGHAGRLEPTATNLASVTLHSASATYGVLAADFDGDGRTDILRWGENPTDNQLWLNKGGGTFEQLMNGAAPGQFNLPHKLFGSDGCYTSAVQDVNSDGLPDIVRVANVFNKDGQACGLSTAAQFFLNDGRGGFTERVLRTRGGEAIPMERRQSKPVKRNFCGEVVSAGDRSYLTDLMVALTSASGNCPTGYGWSSGAAYYLIDINGDGLLDIITTHLSEATPEDPRYLPAPPESLLPCTGCTRVFLANSLGSFDELTTSSIRNVTVYSDQGTSSNFVSIYRSADVNGDGLADLTSVGTPRFRKTWKSLGDGNFAAIDSPSTCDLSIDFNGDGRADCLRTGEDPAQNFLYLADGTSTYKLVSNFNVNGAGQGLKSTTLGQGSAFGSFALDVNGDGRQDIVRWHDDPAQTKIFLSNGDGSFAEAQTSLTGQALRRTDNTVDVVLADFTGRGVTEVLRLSSTPSTTPNALLAAVSGMPADLLMSVTSSTGALTTLTYRSLADPGVGGDRRYSSDRGTFADGPGTSRAVYPWIDLTVPMYVVTDVAADNGVGGAFNQAYAYAGLKADLLGRGLLGFREIQHMTNNPRGGQGTTRTEYLQRFPYTGVAAVNEVRLAWLHWNQGPPVSATFNTYCDLTAQAGAEHVASPASPCEPGATERIRRPYLYKTVETGSDLVGAILPTVTTVNTFNATGDLLKSTVKTTGRIGGSGGLPQESTKIVTNNYLDNNISRDNWILGRLIRSTVQNVVQNTLPALTTMAGNTPMAAATQGSAPAGQKWPVDPAVLLPLIEMILED